ncbi:unnamed protein product [Tilletia controversa]|uniref:Aquaporin n=3 Tax=Tilletia TaxID=13289 RepID=A0A8X7MSH8_9BASI|nr:hypothetical protein CF336_g5819 [Tilletia laevis]KAE8194081.1 hypothetical protein CF328_g4862 [Tilletia controversa]KAE8256702.1 hypothetical protein A4X03_0g5140 [Tilletia caries]KAE8195518.1 hypothetical protein CF335_g5079 [Tilletia laevis]KAE8246513.1 hypothetical protein A4X06_0g4984 [Tilletia controversa]
MSVLYFDLQPTISDAESNVTAAYRTEAPKAFKRRNMGNVPYVGSRVRFAKATVHHKANASDEPGLPMPTQRVPVPGGWQVVDVPSTPTSDVPSTPTSASADDDVEKAHLPKLPPRVALRAEAVAAFAEFAGTFFFLLFSLCIATVAGRQLKNEDGSMTVSALTYSALGSGFALAINAWVFFPDSGGLFNPAITLGLFLAQHITWHRALLLTAVQYIAALAAAGAAHLINPGGIDARTTLSLGTGVEQGLLIELFCTAMLMFAVHMLVGEKRKSMSSAPIGIGLALVLAQLWAMPFTGASLNSARTIGPDVLARSMESYSWIYYIGPYGGVILSSGVYMVLKLMRHEASDQGKGTVAEATLLYNKKGHVVGQTRMFK